APDASEASDASTPTDTTVAEDAGCAPACSGRDCGPDDCGGSCGVCDASEMCQAGLCTPQVKYCTAPCATVSDCLAPDPPPGYRAANFACTGGACRYTGCVGDGDCAVTNTVGGAGTCEPSG